jgi:hypothetical protein
MRPLFQRASLEKLYRATRDVRQRTRAQIVLLAGEQRLTAPAIAAIVRENDQTVRNWHVSLDGRSGPAPFGGG